MMPNIPTDNLYKFIAISGLALLFYCISFPILLHTNAMERMDKLSEELAGITADLGFLKEDAAIASAQGESKEEAIQRFRKSRDVRRQQAIFGEKLKILHRLNAQTEWLPLLSAIGSAVGLLISIVGFWLWYCRLQQPLDNSIKENGSSVG